MKLGYFYAIISSFLLMGSVILNKHLLDFVNPKMLAFVFFSVVFLCSVVVIIYRGKDSYLGLLRQHWKDGMIVGGFNAMAATFFFLSLDLLDAPTTAFLVRFSTVFIIILGVFYLKEKLTRLDIIGIFIAVLGAFVINFSVSLAKLGLLTALVSAFFIALHQTAAKIFVKRTNPLNLVNLRTLFSSSFLLVITLATSSFQAIPLNLLHLFLASGILAGAGFVFFYKALEMIEVSKAAVIRSLDPFIVLVYGFILFQTTPDIQEILGGILIVIGVVIIILKHRLNDLLTFFRKPTYFG